MRTSLIFAVVAVIEEKTATRDQVCRALSQALNTALSDLAAGGKMGPTGEKGSFYLESLTVGPPSVVGTIREPGDF